MPLLDFWRSNAHSVLQQNLKQIVTTAGNGELNDDSPCSRELRTFFSEVDSEHLFGYAKYCLDNAFDNSGLVLQDVVNELGHRLDFDIQPGLYRGRPNKIGFDGIWRVPATKEIVVEVKTTDLYTLNIDKIISYRSQLSEQGVIGESATVLLVVGRNDSGALEAQVRGSRHAWDVRIISVDALVKLVQVKEKSNDPATVNQIRLILQPFEYTKVDRIVDVLFTTTEDVEQSEVPEAAAEEGGDTSRRQERTPRELLNRKREQAVAALSARLGTPLVKAGRTLYASTDRRTRICVAVSKNYGSKYQPYWYAFHPAWRDFLSEADKGFFVLACMDRDEAFAIPFDVVKTYLPNLNTTERKGHSEPYWHVSLTTEDGGEVAWNISRISKHLPLGKFSLSWQGAQ